MKILVATAAAAAALLAAGSVAAQDWRLPANYGAVTLYSGFTPDPFTVNVVAGGSIDASSAISSSCRGWISSAPDVELTYQAGGSLPLIISVNSSSDTTLVINGPDARWYCDDDGGEGLNPSLRWGSPPSGTYDIWIGSYGGQAASATLSISELYTY
ncbi:MAG: peptidase S1 [Caulobacterales bacterium]|nr:peptidase S1 [Caulobacterales bacterium]